MSFLSGSDRQQTHFLPPALEDYIGADNPVRFLDAFVGKLDLLRAGFLFPKESALGSGRPGYHPADLLKLYLYGYLHQLRSSRRLEAECHRNLEVIWLMRELKPDHKTIADFRKNNASAFKAVVREFTMLCRRLDLFGGQLLAVDGSRFKASNAPGKNWTGPRLQRELDRVEGRIDEYLKALEQSDADAQANSPIVSVAELQEKIACLHEYKVEIQQRAQSLAQSGQTQISGSDPDARVMHAAGGGYLVGYNVQAAVDAKHHLLVTAEATNNAADQGQLAPVVREAKETLAIKNADVVADAGYYKAQDIQSCQEMGVEAHVCTPCTSPNAHAGLFDKSAFSYDASRDCYRCPAGAELKRRSHLNDKGRVLQTYTNRKACQNCALKAKCTRSSARMISRWEHEAVLERMEKAKLAAPEKLARRRELIEHCWATLKTILPGGFIVRGLAKVKAEINLAHFAYNLKRAVAVCGIQSLLAAVSA